jgi:hypothetical protein
VSDFFDDFDFGDGVGFFGIAEEEFIDEEDQRRRIMEEMEAEGFYEDEIDKRLYLIFDDKGEDPRIP